ncbi:hypothetical protein NA57DRAFT_70319 [Rhizodiscina lignyota]|uniref:GAT domain-containing protein n=1 Tax=Rhizodiscina lignyota TaxID=1504668 RepID=A0A9P4IM73_9PEZI|nr:hypothetical protein NA57DRAFT_70319 [Rhizodiscina lignyota]
MVIKRFQDRLLGKQRNGSGSDDPALEGDSPQANAARGVRLFCESGGPENSGDEVLHLPVIVESAESSPAAAAAAAYQIRKFLSKDNYGKPHVQYNAIMLIRILADNPGPSFTKNMDTKFSNTMKQLLRECKDQSVQQITRETLSALYQEKGYDTNLNTLFQMWTKEQPGQVRPRTLNAPAFNPQQQQQPFQQPFGFGPGPTPDHFAHGSRSQHTGLPAPHELAARIEEAKTSAKLLQQLVQSTPASELQSNDLVKEFGQRVSAAQKSIQGYINSDNPAPDEDTLQTLIETSEQLSLAASKHQRAILQARRLNGSSPPIQGNPDGLYAGTARPASGAPILNAPALPVRTGSNGLPQNPPRITNTPPRQATYFPPIGPPPGRSPQAATPNDSDTLYNPPPVPPASMRANLARHTSNQEPLPTLDGSFGTSSRPAIPSMTFHNEPIELASPTPPPPEEANRKPLPPITTDADDAEDPFSDEHVSPHPEEPVHYTRPDPPPSLRANPTGYTAIAAEPDQEEPVHYTRTDPPPSLRTNPTGYTTIAAKPSPKTGSPTSYHPGYQSTPSYMHRQQSSGDKLVMHGGRTSPESQGQAPQRMGSAAMSEGSERSSAGGTAERYEVAAGQGAPRGAANVSPLYERNSGSGYRY